MSRAEPAVRKILRRCGAAAAAVLFALAACARVPAVPGVAPESEPYDVVITGGRVVDGTGSAWFYGDVGIIGDRIARVAPAGILGTARARERVDARGLVVAPGFIDIQSHSREDFLTGDGRVVSKVTQGITTEILGEGWTNAPANEHTLAGSGDITDPEVQALSRSLMGPRGFDAWLRAMERHGISTNVGSFVGATTVRVYAKGQAMGPATPAELDTMRLVMRNAMEDGAFGLASALIYPPGSFANTEELIEVARAMAPYGGVYITHMRSEADQFLEAIDESVRIGSEARVPVEIYHLKAAGRRNWPKAARAIAKIDSARRAGLDVQANMYAYIAGGTGLSACLPPWASAEGKLLDNLKDPATRARIRAEMVLDRTEWENLCQLAAPEGVLLLELRKDENKRFIGKRLAEVAAALGKEWPDVVIDLLLAEEHRIGTVYFLMDEQNVALQLRQPWMKFGTDAGGFDPDSAKGPTHPRAYGNYPRLLGKYVREEGVMPLEEAIRKMSSAVATRLSLPERGVLRAGMYADVVVFDPATIADRATFESPHQLSVGVRHVFVNGTAVVRDGNHTGAKPGRVVRGPGHRRRPAEAPRQAQGPDSAAARMRRVESGLLTAVAISGREPLRFTVVERLRHYRVPAVSIAVIDGGKIEWAKAYGMVDAGGTRSADTATLFQAASISKPVAAMAALRLVQEGKLSLDEDVNAKLSTWSVPPSDSLRDKRVTLRGVLSHSAGLTVHGFRGYAAGEAVPTLVQLLDGVPPANSAAIRVDLSPGSQWRYSGGGYSVLQQLLTDVVGRPFPDLMRELVLEPAGMRLSSYSQPLSDSLWSRAATGHRARGEPVTGKWHTYPELAAAGLWTTPSDLARFVIDVQRALSGDGRGVLSPATARQMVTLQSGSFGLGLSLADTGKDARFSHGGANEGFRAIVAGFTERGQGAVVMTNSDNGSALATEIIRAIAREYGWQAYGQVERAVAAVNPRIYGDLAGRYRIALAKDTLWLDVATEADSLVASFSHEGFRRRLYPASETRYFGLDDGVELAFERDATSAVTHVTIHGTGTPLRAPKVR